MGLDDLVSVQGVGDFSLLLRVQTGRGVHSAPFKIRGLLEVKTAEHRNRHSLSRAIAVYMWTIESRHTPVSLHGL